jgi:Fibrobacter succinogenes major domain (Fib_succ_major).
MKKLNIIWMMLPLLAIMSCSKDNNEETAPSVKPEASGTMTDVRDGNTYHWVRYAGLDWTVENSRYNTGDAGCAIYYTNQTIGQGNGANDQLTLKNYGYLYTFSGAKSAAPDGWRLPTDADYEKLEQALGMSADEVEGDGWRGSYQGTLMTQGKNGTGLKFLYAGFKNVNSSSYNDNLKFVWLTAYGYYWTSTSDAGASVAYFRKIQFNTGQVWRHTTDMNNMLSVRFVRDAK